MGFLNGNRCILFTPFHLALCSAVHTIVWVYKGSSCIKQCTVANQTEKTILPILIFETNQWFLIVIKEHKWPDLSGSFN